ncbi:5-hydroxytryptamine receptor 2B-like [Mya arenaria]|uniref:5-hydroxytryptamine receptor 2B-like n=1 Tax=Mya arenaria TaxID=6604 RepID=UPI0022DFBD52|nr:5-hydroxytryptamine receptor 2B-like [Mya arenaria]
MMDNSIDDQFLSESSVVPPWVSMATTVVLVMVFLLCISGNSLVLIIQWRQAHHSSTDYFVVTMAAFDLLTGMTLIPLIVAFLHVPLWQMIASDPICKVYTYVRYTVSIATTVLLSTTALDRYFKICRPHSRVFSATTARRTCLLMSIVFLIGCLPTAFTRELNTDGMLCKRTGALCYVFDSILVLTTAGLFGITSVSYFLVAKQLRKRRRPRPELAVSYNASKRILSDKVVTPREGHNAMPISQHEQPLGDNCQGIEINGATGNQDEGGQLSTITPAPRTLADPPHTRVLGLQNTVGHQNQQPPRTKQTLSMTNRRLTRTTFAMFLITVVYVTSWMLTFVAMILEHAQSWSESTLILRHTLLISYIVNCATNPLFFIWLSSAFRSRVKEALKCNSRR